MTRAQLERARAALEAHRARPTDFPTVGLRRAAVLVPLVLHDDGPRLLFTVRSMKLRHHPGQIAFPGGGAHAGETPEACAQREAAEEVGLVVPEGGVLGRLSPLPSPANYLAVPVVAVLPGPVRPMLDPAEVAETFEVPLGDLAKARPETEEREFRGTIRVLHRYRWRDRDVWGFTGNVVHELLTVLGPELTGPGRPPALGAAAATGGAT